MSKLSVVWILCQNATRVLNFNAVKYSLHKCSEIMLCQR